MSNLTKTQTMRPESKLVVTVWKGLHSSHKEIRLNFLSVEASDIPIVWSRLYDTMKDAFNIHIPTPNDKLQVVISADKDAHEQIRSYMKTLPFPVQWCDYSRT
jgi:hypothetical protein